MNILLVEDDEYKRTRVLDYLRTQFAETSVTSAASLMSGVRAVRSAAFDLVLLDMTLPNYDLRSGETGGGMHAFGGVEFLKQLRRFHLTTRVIVITQFGTFGQPPDVKDLAELDREMSSQFERNYLGSIYYHASQDAWMEALERLMSGMEGDVNSDR